MTQEKTKTAEEEIPAALLHEREQALATLAPRCDLAALLRVLLRAGYTWETLSFEGVRSLTRTPGLVQELRFLGNAPRRAVVRLNMGLLGPNGALPSYFHRFAERLSDPRPFLNFIRFFDDVLLRNHAFVTCPREGIAAGSSLPAAYRVTAGFGSAPRLHWLFRAVVPELPVDVRPMSFRAERPDDGARFGAARLDGSAIMGPAYTVVERGFLVRLYAEEELDEAGRPWEAIIKQRYDRHVAPVLVRPAVPVQVRICFERYGTGAAVSPAAQIGVRRIRTKEPQAWEVRVAGPMT